MPNEVIDLRARQRRILVVDDHTLFAEVLAIALERAGFEVDTLCEADGEEVAATALFFRPDLGLVDLHLGGPDPVAVVARLHEAGAEVVMLTGGTTDGGLLADCLGAGAAAVLHKQQPLAEVLEFVTRLADGSAASDPVARQAAIHALRQAPRPPDVHQVLAGLTGREQEVLAALVEGRSAADIAAEHFIAMATVRTHIRSILRKFGVRSQLAAVALARHAGVGVATPMLNSGAQP